MYHIFDCHLVAQEEDPIVLLEAEKKVGIASTPFLISRLPLLDSPHSSA